MYEYFIFEAQSTLIVDGTFHLCHAILRTSSTSMFLEARKLINSFERLLGSQILFDIWYYYGTGSQVKT